MLARQVMRIGSNQIDTICIPIKGIESGFIVNPPDSKGKASKPYRQSQDADNGLGAVFPEVAQCDF
jgi:hypothetical protein